MKNLSFLRHAVRNRQITPPAVKYEKYLPLPVTPRIRGAIQAATVDGCSARMLNILAERGVVL